MLSTLRGHNTSYNLFLLAIRSVWVQPQDVARESRTTQMPSSPVSTLSSRFYASDPVNDQSVVWGRGPSLFGFAAPPTVEVKKGQ